MRGVTFFEIVNKKKKMTKIDKTREAVSNTDKGSAFVKSLRSL
jgi:hypothetical protein